MIVVDTHVWVWYVADRERLSTTASELVEREISKHSAYVSSMSAWEVALLEAKGRLQLTIPAAEWIARVESLPLFRFVPVDNAIAVKSVGLAAPLHEDPADRIIIATALSLGAQLVTKDQRIRDYPHVRSIW